MRQRRDESGGEGEKKQSATWPVLKLTHCLQEGSRAASAVERVLYPGRKRVGRKQEWLTIAAVTSSMCTFANHQEGTALSM